MRRDMVQVPTAIYRIRAGSESWRGKGKVVIKRSGHAFGTTLRVTPATQHP